MNRRLLDLLAGWERYLQDCAEGVSCDCAFMRDTYLAEAATVAELYQEAGSLTDHDGEGHAKFIFDRVLYMVLDGKPR